jgi:c-di-GMP-binding flagellar brake protein YcgR
MGMILKEFPGNTVAAPAGRIRPDRRAGARKVMRVQARISIPGEAPLDVHTADLSLGGVSVTSVQQLALEQECVVELGISVPELASPPALRARVRYCGRLPNGQFRIGFQFSSVSIEAAELIVAVLG